MKEEMERFRHFLIRAAMVMTLCILGFLAVSSLFVTAQLRSIGGREECIVFLKDSFVVNLLATAGLIALLLILRKRVRGRLLGLLAAAAALCSFGFLLGANTSQMYDALTIAEAAQLFARGNYKAMNLDYFHVYSYQLGICLPMEMVLRLLPGLDIGLFMQGLGAVLNAASILIIAIAAGEICHDRRVTEMTGLLALFFMTAYLYPVHAYNTLPMMFCVSCAILGYVRYVNTRKMRYGFFYAGMLAIGYMLKPNAAVAVITLGICAVLDVMRSRDRKLLGFVLLSVLLSGLLARAVIWQYEMRSGVTLTSDLSMLARFTMGLQEGGGEAGWFNRYTEQFFPLEVTDQEERAIALADLTARLREMAADPAMTVDFFGRKLLSQWQEPTCDALWTGWAGEPRGVLAGFAQAIYAQESAIRLALEGYMNIFQQALYVLSCVGLVRWILQKPCAMRLIFPVYVLGGILYHELFEAKSLYMYIYLVMLLPLAAYGLFALGEWIDEKRKGKTER